MSKKTLSTSTKVPVFPHREGNTAIVKTLHVPNKRSALFLAIENDFLHDNQFNELSFEALPENLKTMFQFLLYLTYSCKGALIQVTLENPDFSSMSPAIREDFSHGRLFCFVLDMSNNGESLGGIEFNDQEDIFSYSQMFETVDSQSINLDVFNITDSSDIAVDKTDETLDEAFNAFMRLQLVRKKVTSLSYAMMAMRDENNELKSAFDYVDISCDVVNFHKVEKKKIKDLQGSMYIHGTQSGRYSFGLPDSIAKINLKTLETAVGIVTDTLTLGEGKGLFITVMSKLMNREWCKHKVIWKYNNGLRSDMLFLERLKEFTDSMCKSSNTCEVDIKGLLVFRYSLETLIDVDQPDSFREMLIHRHVPIPKTRIDKVLSDIRTNGRTQYLALNLNNGQCYCRRIQATKQCQGECQIAYSCFYNACELHPFQVTLEEHNYYFAHLYPHLAKLERLSKEMKVKYKGRRRFESIADMVFNILTRSCSASMYDGLKHLFDDEMANSSLSLGRDSLSDIYEMLCIAPGNYNYEICSLHPLKVYDQALVRYLYCDTLHVGRLFQASTTFNYIITNTAPRYTIERIMLFNITGPGEGKSYANKVLNYQFHRVKGCIETLTSFTPQAFKYKQKRSASVVFIDDAHICHEKNTRAQDKESNVIPNTFKNLLDNSMLESDIVTRDPVSSRVDTVKHLAVHNCGFVWNANTLAFVSEAWADRCLIMETEYPSRVTRTSSTKQIQDTVEKHRMEQIVEVCLYRQNLIQAATMIAESDIMQFGTRFDSARAANIAAFQASHIVCAGMVNRRIPFCINQLVYAEALKLACHFVFDIWIPPWTDVPAIGDYPNLMCYMKQLNVNRMKALNKLSFGQICLETNAVYKLCTATCLSDLCPRVMDQQARFACQTLGFVLSQIYAQNLKTTIKDQELYITGIDTMFFPENDASPGTSCSHELLQLCSSCKVPARLGQGQTQSMKSLKLCKYKCATNNNMNTRKGSTHPRKKVASVQIPLEAVYDILALYAPHSHMIFWDKLCSAMVAAYEKGQYQQMNAFGQCTSDTDEGLSPGILTFPLDLTVDPICSLILESTSAFYPLNELKFTKSFVGGDVYQCTAPLYYGGVLMNKIPEAAPLGAHEASHLNESRLGAMGTFHGPRLRVYSTDYSGVPLKNASSFCSTRTVYNQDQIVLTLQNNECSHLFELEEDWEWKDAMEVFNAIHGDNVFSVSMLKCDYTATMLVVKDEFMGMRPEESTKLSQLINHLKESNTTMALDLRLGVKCNPEKRKQPLLSPAKKKKTCKTR